jgi:hypothetical protein
VCRIDTSGRLPLLLAFNGPCNAEENDRVHR